MFCIFINDPFVTKSKVFNIYPILSRLNGMIWCDVIK